MYVFMSSLDFSEQLLVISNLTLIFLFSLC